MKRRILCLLLAAAMLLGLSVTALAGEPDAQCAAESLYQLGLFNGTGTYADGSPKFELDRAPTRFEAVTMLVRLLGKEDEAKTARGRRRSPIWSRGPRHMSATPTQTS